MPDPKRIAYIRTSPADASDHLGQLDWMPVDERFVDELVSQRDHRRPQRKQALDQLQRGDTLVVQGMERLARDGNDLRRILVDLNVRGVTVEFVAESLMLFPCEAAQRDRELALIEAGQRFVRASDAERQRVGIAKARKAKRKYNGRHMKLTERQIVDMKARLLKLGENPGDSITKIAADFRVSRQTVYTYEKAIDPLLVAANRLARSKRQLARGDVESAVKTRADAIVKRRAAFQSVRGVPIADIRAARKLKDEDGQE